MTEASHATRESPAKSVGATRPQPLVKKPLVKKPNKKRARVPFDKRYVLGKRIAQLSAIYATRAGLDPSDPDPVLAAQCETAARLTGLAEDATAKAARHDARVNLDDVVRLQRVADLAVRRLRLDAHRAPAAPNLSSYLAKHSEGTP